MNIQTANSILKFLEEPIDEIIAILVVDNINLMLPTIISRCQVIKLNKKPLSLDSIDNFSTINSLKLLSNLPRYTNISITKYI
jgi:DNA polymerase III gamma/tau subunit